MRIFLPALVILALSPAIVMAQPAPGSGLGAPVGAGAPAASAVPSAPTASASTPASTEPEPQPQQQQEEDREPVPAPSRRIDRPEPAEVVVPAPVQSDLVLSPGDPGFETFQDPLADLGSDQFRGDAVLVRLALDSSPATVAGIASDYGLQVGPTLAVTLLNQIIQRFELAPGQDLEAVIRSLLVDPRVIDAQAERLYRPANVVGAAGVAWRRPRAGPGRGDGITIAMIDTGIAGDHPVFANSQIEILTAFERLRPDDHGTSVAALIVGTEQGAGLAPSARLIAVEAFRDTGQGIEGTSLDIVAALDLAAQRDAQIYNLSFAGPSDPLMADMVIALSGSGVALVAASGNDGPTAPPSYPAAYEAVLSVGAVGRTGEVWSGTAIGRHQSFSAPGVDLLVPVARGFRVSSGTSLATAFVSGALALALERTGGVEQALDDLRARVVDLGAPGRDDIYGWGVISP